MGTLVYGFEKQRVSMDDRSLVHLEVIIVQKLRRGESFLFTHHRSAEEGSGRVAYWMHPAIPLIFEFSGSKGPRINRAWLAALMVSSNSAGGLTLTEEPPDLESAPTG